MPKRIVFNDPEAAEFIANTAQCVYNPNTDHSIGVVYENIEGWKYPLGGAIYTSFTGSSCFVHCAGRDTTWMSREFLALAAHYPFVQLGLAVLLAFVEEANAPALDFGLHLGFEKQYAVPNMFPSGSGVLLMLPRPRCRWLRLKLKYHYTAGEIYAA